MHFVLKRYTVFGEFSLLLSKDTFVISESFARHGFALIKYNQNLQSGLVQNSQNIVISNQKERVTISFSMQRIDIEYSGYGSSELKYLNYLNEVLTLYEKGFYRIAISQVVAIEDEKDLIKKKIAKTAVEGFDLKSLTEYEFRFNSPVMVEKEEINRIVVLNDGFIQNIKLNNGVPVPVMKKSLYFTTDVNTSEKNFVGRFDQQELCKTFNELEKHNGFLIKKIEEYIKE